MIYTKEPVNTYYAYLTAHCQYNTAGVNEIFTAGLTKHIKRHPEAYGTIHDEPVEHYYTAPGCGEPTKEHTLKVHCTSWYQVLMLAELACWSYDQESIFLVNAQTHTASLLEIKTRGEYAQSYKALEVSPLGVFRQQDTGAEHYINIDGKRWEVAPDANGKR